MLNPFFQRAFAPISQLLEIELVEDPEGESFGPVRVPGGLERPIRLDALPERERAAGPDRGKVGRRADSLPAGRGATDRIDAGRVLALLVGRDGGLGFASVHCCYPFRFFGALGLS